MNIAISGSTGFIGSALVPHLSAGGHTIVRMVRSRPELGTNAVYWDPATGVVDAASLEGVDVVVNLAGENVGTGRWTVAKKARMRDSRVQGTRLLAETLAGLRRRPRVFVCASAVGYYGDRGDELLTEASPPGSGFMAGLVRAWEAVSQPAAEAGIRVVNTRFGMVLGASGGSLSRLLTPFRLGIGGRLGSGRQYMSWVALDDLVAVIDHVLRTESLQGPVNVVSPHPVTNREFTEILGRVLARPTLFPVPTFVLRLLFGEVADEVLLKSQRVVPARLLASGYSLRYPELEGALRHVLGKPGGE